MKKLTAEDLHNLKHGDEVYRFINSNGFRRLLFVSKMPKDANYLIFCDGEYLTHLYINPKDNSFRDDWYSGEYNERFEGELMIKYLEEKVESLKRIYLSETETKTSHQWQDLYPEVKVLDLDPDGWDRKNFHHSWFQELIAFEEYNKRLLYSTCSGLQNFPLQERH